MLKPYRQGLLATWWNVPPRHRAEQFAITPHVAPELALRPPSLNDQLEYFVRGGCGNSIHG